MGELVGTHHGAVTTEKREKGTRIGHNQKRKLQGPEINCSIFSDHDEGVVGHRENALHGTPVWQPLQLSRELEGNLVPSGQGVHLL
ncbi:Fyve, Rhogef And Ph Domain-Containing Protein 6 [Manis pentadactyla]|nr:Fyve, Rhogef And Ph Domain-Containing Protein 6 [Manis pentadactyla]